jgi:hypothetical protein
MLCTRNNAQAGNLQRCCKAGWLALQHPQQRRPACVLEVSGKATPGRYHHVLSIAGTPDIDQWWAYAILAPK